MKLVLFASALSILASSTVSADDEDKRATTIGVTYGHETLSNNLPNWHEHALLFQHQLEKHHVLGLEVADTNRFGLSDTRFGISYTRPLDNRLTATFDAGFSPTHQVVAEFTIGAALQIEFAPSWLLHVGGRTTEYDAVTVNQALIGLEHYFTRFSWAATLRPTRAFGETTVSGGVRGSYYYGGRNSVNLIVSGGEEAVSIGSTVTLAQVRAIAVTGHHWLGRRWSVRYAANHTRQGSVYNRSGVHLSVLYTF